MNSQPSKISVGLKSEFEILEAENISVFMSDWAEDLFSLDIKWVKFVIWKTMLNIFLYLLVNKWFRKSISTIISYWVRNLEIEENTVVKNIERFNKNIWSKFPEYTIDYKKWIWYQIWEWVYQKIFETEENWNRVKVYSNQKFFWVSINNNSIVYFELSKMHWEIFLSLLKSPTKLPNRTTATRIRNVLKKAGLWNILIVQAESEGYYSLYTDYSQIKDVNLEVAKLLWFQVTQQAA